MEFDYTPLEVFGTANAAGGTSVRSLRRGAGQAPAHGGWLRVALRVGAHGPARSS